MTESEHIRLLDELGVPKDADEIKRHAARAATTIVREFQLDAMIRSIAVQSIEIATALLADGMTVPMAQTCSTTWTTLVLEGIGAELGLALQRMLGSKPQ
jgi:hypothetical protein